MGVKKNFLYSSIITISNFVFPLITFPYVSRVLGVSNVGICNYVDSIINYFILFSMMGIPAIGIREIAAAKGNRLELSKTFSSLFLLNAIFTVVAFSVLIILVFFFIGVQDYKILLLVGSAKLLANFFLIEWLYKGLEEFKYITQRTLFVKAVYVISVFVFVKSSSDYGVYYFLSVLAVVVNAIVNYVYSRHFVIYTIKKIRIYPYLRPSLVLGIYTILTSMYTSFNVAYLGYKCGALQVGLYTTATKLFAIILAFYTTFTGVLLPRMSSLYAQGSMDEFKAMINKSIDLLLTLSVPIVFFSFLFAPEIIRIFAGPGYEDAVIPARIVMPLIFIIGYEQVLVLQILMPMKQDKATLVNSIIGAIVGLVLNLILIRYAAIGSSIVWLLSEIVVLCVAQYYVCKYVSLSFPLKKLMKNLISYLPIIVLLYLLNSALVLDYVVSLILAFLIMFFYFLFVQINYLQNPLVFNLLRNIKNFIFNKTL